ncbi:MAG: DUF805 domain-containing protein [Firmicutes bacterium]|nr:DUF805 domain-containing protein [Bacillota bacterium]
MDGILDPYMEILKNWKQMHGTTDRRTYWSALLTALVILAVLIWFGEKIPGLNILVKGFLLLMAVPFFTATIRRLHDVDKSAWNLLFLMIPVVGFFGIFLFLITDSHENSRFSAV